MTTERENTRRIDGAALRGLCALERTLKQQGHDLMELDCEDHDVAACIVYALEVLENALTKTRDTKKRISGGTKPADDEDQRAGH